MGKNVDAILVLVSVCVCVCVFMPTIFCGGIGCILSLFRRPVKPHVSEATEGMKRRSEERSR